VSGTGTAADWDLTGYFPEFDGAAYREFRDSLEREAEALEAVFSALGPLTRTSGAGWREALLRLEDAAGRAAHLGSYLGCLSAADAGDTGVQREVARSATPARAPRWPRLRTASSRGGWQTLPSATPATSSRASARRRGSACRQSSRSSLRTSR